MMIYVNGRFLLQDQTGVNRFAYELCRAMVRLGQPFTLCLPQGEIKSCYDTSGFCLVRWGRGMSHVWEQIFLPLWFWRQKGPKVLVCFTGLGPFLGRKKIMTIHDLAFMVNPSWYSRSYAVFYKALTPLCAATSMRVLTVSEFSKSEITRLLGIPGEKISVINNAVSPAFTERGVVGAESSPVKVAVCHEKYVLAVSSIDPRKNFQTLLAAFAYVKDPDVKLYVVGGQSRIYTTSIDELNQTAFSKRVKWLGRVSDADLRAYYANALCFIYPSLYEGFGIPPLEAMACGTPVIVSAIPSLSEVCEDAALYVDPYDAKDIAAKINSLVSNPELRDSLVKRGRKRCEHFSWLASAEKLQETFRAVRHAMDESASIALASNKAISINLPKEQSISSGVDNVGPNCCIEKQRKETPNR